MGTVERRAVEKGRHSPGCNEKSALTERKNKRKQSIKSGSFSCRILSNHVCKKMHKKVKKSFDYFVYKGYNCIGSKSIQYTMKNNNNGTNARTGVKVNQ